MIVMKKQKNCLTINKILYMEVQLTTVTMRKNNLIEQICALTTECATDYKNLSTQDKIVKLNHILFLISLVEEEDINLLSKKMALIYKDAVEWVWFKLRDIGYQIIAKNVKLADHKYNEEEDLSKLSKEELIARLKEATK